MAHRDHWNSSAAGNASLRFDWQAGHLADLVGQGYRASQIDVQDADDRKLQVLRNDVTE